MSPLPARVPMLPQARGGLTEQLFAQLRRPPGRLRAFGEPEDFEDAALALYVMYELHYRGFDDVDERWEWQPSVLQTRAELESTFERDLRAGCASRAVDVQDVVSELRTLAAAHGPSLSGWLYDHGTRRELREFAVHRSAYQLKEADPHTWAVPRLHGPAKAALLEIQFGEYGDGRANAMHATLFANTLHALDLDPAYGAYLDQIPAATLATVNLVSMFGLHRRLRGALVGHLALFEMCSAVPMSRYAATLRRLGLPDAAPFYDAHAEVDEHHGLLALHDMADALARDQPELADDIVFGARALDVVEAAFTRHLLDSWTSGRSSLRPC